MIKAWLLSKVFIALLIVGLAHDVPTGSPDLGAETNVATEAETKTKIEVASS